MAIRITKEVVCDFGERHSGEIRQWRLTVDQESQVFDLCPACSKPLATVWERGEGGQKLPARMRVTTMSEIEAQKQRTPLTR